MKTFAEILQNYVGATGKLTRFKGEYHRFRVAFNIDEPEVVNDMREQGVELYKLIEVGRDYAAFQSVNRKVFIPIHTLVLED